MARQPFGDTRRCFGVGDGTDREAVVPDYAITLHGNVGLCTAGRLVVERKTGEIAIEPFVSTVEGLNAMRTIQLLDNPARTLRRRQWLFACLHQAGKPRPGTCRQIQCGLEFRPLGIVENEKATISQGLGRRGQTAVDQEFANCLVLRLGRTLNQLLGSRRDAKVDALGLR